MKKALIVGMANDHSIAWGIAQSLHQQGWELAFTYQGESLERRVRPLAESVGSRFIFPMDIRDSSQVAKVVDILSKEWGHVNAVLHSVAFADKKDLEGAFYNTSKEGFLLAMEVSAYSLVELVRQCKPLLSAAAAEGGASVLTLSYYGAEKVVPHYNVMGVAKAALEATVRYLAADLGPEKIRVNALSAGPVRTLAAAGIKGFKGMMHVVAEKAPLRRNVTLEEVGNTGAFLLGAHSSGITGETLYVDSGYNIMGM
jgi:enoyl-[acyl-carrier protein] reductase I